MSNHFSAANLKSPGDDPRLDLTDLFASQSSAVIASVPVGIDGPGLPVQADQVGKNVLSLALEVPDELLGPDPRIGVWATVSGYSDDEARAAVMTVLPDILRYDRSQRAHYPNG